MFIFEKATQTWQLRTLFVAFHIDKAPYSEKDNILYGVSENDGIFPALSKSMEKFEKRSQIE
ncbi:MAG: hypothetical protein WBC22_12060 [Sedimentisphaerales bacterium]